MGDSRGNSSRVFTREFKLAAVKELDSGKPAGYVTRQLEIKPNLLVRWRRELRKHPAKGVLRTRQRDASRQPRSGA